MKYIKIICILLSAAIFKMGTAYATPEKNTDLHIKITKAFFQWNSKNLISSADLKKSDLSHFFAPDFIVEANGVRHNANYDNYFQFLNKFRDNIKTIRYELDDFIVDKDHVVIPLKAHILSNNGNKQLFDAILILKFNKNHKIVLWREVYALVK